MAEPRYRQIAEDLRQKIESGELAHGTQIATELELRDKYDASRNTIRGALRWLVNRGLVETRPGHGTFVVPRIDPFVTIVDAETGFGRWEAAASYESAVAAGRRKATVSAPRIEIHRASAFIARELTLPEGSLVVSRNQERYIDHIPWSLQTSFYPMRYVDAGARRLIEAVDMPDGALNYLAEKLGIKQVGWRDTITIRAPRPNEAAFFKLPDDGQVALFEIHRTAFEPTGPLRLTVTTYPANRNKFVMTGGDVPS